VGVEIKSGLKGAAEEDTAMLKPQISMALDIEDVKVLIEQSFQLRSNVEWGCG
jgi:hypothetical protein